MISTLTAKIQVFKDVLGELGPKKKKNKQRKKSEKNLYSLKIFSYDIFKWTWATFDQCNPFYNFFVPLFGIMIFIEPPLTIELNSKRKIYG